MCHVQSRLQLARYQIKLFRQSKRAKLTSVYNCMHSKQSASIAKWVRRKGFPVSTALTVDTLPLDHQGGSSSSSAFPSYFSGVHHSYSSSAFPSYISGVHQSSSSSVFPRYISGVHHSSSSSSAFSTYISGVHHSSSSAFPSYISGLTILLLLRCPALGFTILLLLLRSPAMSL